MDTRSTVSDARSVGHLFEFRTFELEVPSHAVTEVEQAAEDLARHAHRHERGTRLFAVLRDADRPNRLLFTAVFDDEVAVQTHERSEPAVHFAALLLAVGAAVRCHRWMAVAGI